MLFAEVSIGELSIDKISITTKWYEKTFAVMGTQAKFEFEWHNDKEANQLMEKLVNEMHRIDATMSPYKATSELSKINLKAAKKPLIISTELFTLIKRSLDFSKLTSGAFDISFSSVGYLYNYREGVKPNKDQIDHLKEAINFKNIQLNEKSSTIYFSDPRVKIDLGGIAKGYAVDRCIEILRLSGIKNAYVNAGGDSRIIGRKNDRLWYIGIKHPRDTTKLVANLPLENIAVSTSGDYERFFIQDGVRYHHIIDPTTGNSASKIQSVTLLANDSITADALSTSVFVLGVQDGMSLINQLEGISAIVIDNKSKLFLSKDMGNASE